MRVLKSQLLGECLVENGTLGPQSIDALLALGFTAAADPCAGCVGQCEDDAELSPDDAELLACLQTAAPATVCGPGLAGTAAFTTLSTCCAELSSNVCQRFCDAFASNQLIGSILLPWCE